MHSDLSLSSPHAHTFKLRVYYEDTDVGGFVYHANYLKFFERARTEYLISCRSALTAIYEKYQLSFVIKSANIKYEKPAKLEQQLVIKTKVVKQGKASLVFEQALYHAASAERLCHATIVVVAVNDDTKPMAIPTALKQELERGI